MGAGVSSRGCRHEVTDVRRELQIFEQTPAAGALRYKIKSLVQHPA
jgi:hypothetical protein